MSDDGKPDVPFESPDVVHHEDRMKVLQAEQDGEPMTEPIAVQAPDKTGQIYAKLAKVMAQVKRIKETGYNSHFKYKFATHADVSDLVREALAEQGVAFFPSMDSYEKQGNTTICQWTMRFIDGETGEVADARWYSEAQDNQDKGFNKAASFAVKYYLLKTFLISTGDEPDPDADAPQASNGRSRQSKGAQKVPPKKNEKPAGNDDALAAWLQDNLKGATQPKHIAEQAGVTAQDVIKARNGKPISDEARTALLSLAFHEKGAEA